MLQLNGLVRLVKKRKRVGRGGSRGGTSGRGHKGQGSRSGGSVDVGFEGGQMPLYRRLPKRGFKNARFKRNVQIVHLDDLEKKFDDGQVVSIDSLVEKGLVRRSRRAGEPIEVKILRRGELNKKLVIEVAMSKSVTQVVGGAQSTATQSKEM